ncbi:MAG: hypothetical protein CM15mV12_1690 [uncultured marine virus]|nr:MAG: hypothetical protein CM15mV12_1690 [uncultured marine virus]
MNDIWVFIYLMVLKVFGMTCVYMFMMMRSTLAEFDKQPVKSYNNVMRAYTPHPEAPKDGEEVMGLLLKVVTLMSIMLYSSYQ